MVARFLLPGLLMAAPAMGQVPDSSDAARIRQAVAQGRALPLPRILAIARDRLPGEVLKVELEDMAGKLDYEVRVLAPDGRLRAITLDARSGAILRIESK